MLEDQSSGSLGDGWENNKQPSSLTGAGSKSKKILSPPFSRPVALTVFGVCGKAGNGMSCSLGLVELGWGTGGQSRCGTVGGLWVWLLDVHSCAEAGAPFGTHDLSSGLCFLCCSRDPGMGAVPKSVHLH